MSSMLVNESSANDQTTSPVTALGGGQAGPQTALWLAGLLGLVSLCYWETIRFTADVVMNAEDMAHGLFAPIAFALIVWQNWDEIFGGVRRGSVGALALLGVSGALGILTALGGSTTLNRVALIVSIYAVFWLIGGGVSARAMIFPCLLLVFTFPIPQVLYGEITQPLQLLASVWSENALEALGYTVLRDGNIIQLPGHTLSVAEACSGLRSLITLAFFTIVYAYFLEDRVGVRALLAVLTVPAALLLNTARVTITGILVQIDPKYTHGTYHDALGWGCFALAFGLILLAHWGLKMRLQRGAAHAN